ncbi:hypothetical protein POM88_046111 [Heracleum sosnowskyi]|uniref:Auxin response factor n=1 Tax=Heracleum sosnowskyi TaxID=360622 RepID=A0AAD8M6T9_9APIA|nr:hypothetical protein POM88_046111 [Heracleum sosnowskyi]
MAAPLQNNLRPVDPTIWRACAGNFVHVPPVGSMAYYIPQGHAQAKNCTSSSVVQSQPLILCRVMGVDYLADTDTNEILAKIQLFPVQCKLNELTRSELPELTQSEFTSVVKVLTPSDANNGGGFSVPKSCADIVFPPLDFNADPPVQTLRVKDVLGAVWEFRHIYRGTPRRHLLTTGWSKFVNSKKLVAGDSVVFMRSQRSGQNFVGIRRAMKAKNVSSNSRWNYLGVAADGGEEDKCGENAVKEAVDKAVRGVGFEIVYHPKVDVCDFVVQAEKVESSILDVPWMVGAKVKMALETEDLSRMTWMQGTVSKINQGGSKNTPWKMLQVTWDDPDAVQNMTNEMEKCLHLQGQGARPDQICVSGVANFIFENTNQTGSTYSVRNMSPIVESVSTELNTGSAQLSNLSADPPREIQFFGTEVAGTRVCSTGSPKVGEIPLEIGNLRSLEHFRMESSSTGPVPSTLFNISSLEIIELSKNKLSGSLSADIQWNVPLLKDLNLQSNLFSGKISSGLWECKRLQMLSLAENNFTGSLSKQIGNLTLLRGLNLDSNNFTGTLPTEIGYLNLELLFVSSNKLTGEIPIEVFNISTLRVITFQFNQFYGNLPQSSGLWLPNLEELYLDNNRLSGSIPVALSNASKLTILEMTTNQFSGYIPNTLGSLRSLRRLHLGENNLTRESSSTELRFFYSLTNCRDLQVLEISMNQFNGVLPAVVGNLSTSLRIFSAFNSKIKGQIPIGIGNLSSLNMLTLDSNELTGIIPSTIGRLKYMEHIYLEHNKLNGTIPYEICLLEKIGDLYLSDNQLSGSIPACLGKLSSLTRLYMDSNKLTSNVPSTLWKRVDLIGLICQQILYLAIYQ